MSTNKTKNYALHSWEAEDDFLRTEFNENFAKLDGALGEKAEIISGCYVGDGEAQQTIHLGFTPRMVLVISPTGMYNDNYRTYSGMAITQRDMVSSKDNPILTLTDNGFTVYYLYDTNAGMIPRTNTKDSNYSYLAMR